MLISRQPHVGTEWKVHRKFSMLIVLSYIKTKFLLKALFLGLMASITWKRKGWDFSFVSVYGHSTLEAVLDVHLWWDPEMWLACGKWALGVLCTTNPSVSWILNVFLNDDHLSVLLKIVEHHCNFRKNKITV